MKTDELIAEDSLISFCRKWGIRELAVFGSVLRDDFSPGSDVDFLVSFHKGRKPGWPGVLDLQEELSRLVNRPVDVVERGNLERSENYIKRAHILRNSQVIYVEK
jgi:hypothetical protein